MAMETTERPLACQDEYLNSAQVRRRYGGVSAMWLYRRGADPEFPQPMRIGRRKFWRRADLVAYEQKLASMK
jgi:predicted DNA-binding transcriptional regulator AlpA